MTIWETPDQMRLRWIRRDGKLILQYVAAVRHDHREQHDTVVLYNTETVWKDIPFAHETPEDVEMREEFESSMRLTTTSEGIAHEVQ